MPTTICEHRKKTNRKRKRIFEADNEADALEMAEADETLVEKIVELPPEKPTDAQLNFARSNDIKIPQDSTFEEVKYIISSSVDEPASEVQIELARELGVKLAKRIFHSKWYVASAIVDYLEWGSLKCDKEVVRWYVYSVAKHIRKEKWNSPKESNLPLEMINLTMNRILMDKQLVKSLVRELDNLGYFALIKFGDPSSGQNVASKNTIAFKRTKKLLESELKPVKNRKARKEHKKSTINIFNTEIGEKFRLVFLGFILLLIVWLLTKLVQ